MMKKEYEKPIMECLEFTVFESIMTESGDLGGGVDKSGEGVEDGW